MTRSVHRPASTAARRASALLVAAALVLAACGGDEAAEVPPVADAPPAAAPVIPAGPLTPEVITPQLIALGDSIYHGQAGAGGICYTCHGGNAEGSTLAPALTDQQWLHGDGSLDMIATIVRNGVQQPLQYPGPMPAFTGVLTDPQIVAVSAYVYSISHPGVGGAGT